VPKIVNFGGDLRKFWPKQVRSSLAHPLAVKKSCTNLK